MPENPWIPTSLSNEISHLFKIKNSYNNKILGKIEVWHYDAIGI